MIPRLVLSNEKGDIFVHPTLRMAAFDGCNLVSLCVGELIPLPKGSTLFFMPGYRAIGFDDSLKNFFFLGKFKGARVFPVAAFVVPGFTRIHLPAAEKKDLKLTLPLWPYTAVGWRKGKFYVSSVKVDLARKQDPAHYMKTKLLKKNIALVLKKFPKNRLFKHLSFCALTYNCRNAQNLFLKRWEAPLPVSPDCNASCLGCLSYQEKNCALASHKRISFVPTPLEVAEVAVSHLTHAVKPIVSFGQGCEGEPLLQFPVLKGSIEIMRANTKRGTIHLNTNGSRPEYICELARAGLNSVRISVNSFKEEYYKAYFRPRGYSLPDVLRSVVIAKKSGLFVSLNLLTFPGLTDDCDEVERLLGFLKKGHVDFLQLRNLCIDQELLLSAMPSTRRKPIGILKMIRLIKKECPSMRLGYFNRAKEEF